MLERPLYLDACATTPLLPEAAQAMADAQHTAWGNPSSLHAHGLAAAECLERARQQLAGCLQTGAEAVHWCSGATESVHLALLGAAATLPPGRLLISAVEHPAVAAAAAALVRQGWQLDTLPVDAAGVVDLQRLAERLAPPTRLVSVIWGQSEVGTIQPIETIGRLCREFGVLLHTDAVQYVPHHRLSFAELPVDLLTLTAHKLGGPRGIAALLVRPQLRLQPLLGGGGQEGGLRAGTEPVVLAAGFAAAMQASCDAIRARGVERQRQQRDGLLADLLQIAGVSLSGPDPRHQPRLPHHISVVVRDRWGDPLSGRQLVRALSRHGVAASSGSACRSAAAPLAPSPVLLALGYAADVAAAGVRFSLGPWLDREALLGVPDALERAIADCSRSGREPPA
ncbi:MAG: aminotransferase class V-fold PLP-dependent enzyme [Cyanobacteria bacterium K_DeepCast_35m_m2_023]|nr:aminotransferase class V-fold PLP-dependent enzyme [Cyanobacteria bacterium K_DeepCast_35m_m2_023]